MPISPENKARYPNNWDQIRKYIMARADSRCEFCDAVNYEAHPDTGSKVVLTVAHLDHTPERCEDWNLRALCQRCHNRLDATYRKQNRRIRTLERKLEVAQRVASAASDLHHNHDMDATCSNCVEDTRSCLGKLEIAIDDFANL